MNNPAIPNEKNEEAISSATGGIMDQLKSMAGEGGLSSITSLFQGGNNQAVSKIGNGVAGDLMQKFGISSEQAGDIVSKLVPTVMSKFVSKTNDPNDNSFNLQDIIGKLGGGSGSGGGLMDQVKGLF